MTYHFRGHTQSLPAKADPLSEFLSEYVEDSLPSFVKGTPEDGSMENGKLFPFSGANFQYFDTLSYVSGRAFLDEKVRTLVVNTYQRLEMLEPNRTFCIMECSHQHGGNLHPHITHQNGRSIDFMVPLLKNGEPYTELDKLGVSHNWLEFDDEGRLSSDPSISIDFDLIGLHLLLLQEEAKKVGLKIEKVIFKMELKPELLATENGAMVEKSAIYITKKLSALINALHDDHYHVDFTNL